MAIDSGWRCSDCYRSNDRRNWWFTAEFGKDKDSLYLLEVQVFNEKYIKFVFSNMPSGVAPYRIYDDLLFAGVAIKCVSDGDIQKYRDVPYRTTETQKWGKVNG